MKPITPSVLISLSSFGASEVRRHGQQWFAGLSADAGADGVEVRGELLVDPRGELPAIGALARERGIDLVYSSPEGLWNDDAGLDEAALQRGLEAARSLGAPRLKMSIGGFTKAGAAGAERLARLLEGQSIELVIENDQTPSAGTLPALSSFFDTVRAAGLSLGMTFDMGNWHWTGEDPLQAAVVFASAVGYVHCKGVQRQPHQWVAVPLASSAGALARDPPRPARRRAARHRIPAPGR